MWGTIRKEWQAKIVLFLLVLLTLWWFVSPQIRDNFGGERFLGDFGSIYVVMALWGACCGVVLGQKWGGMSSLMGKAIYMFSFGLFAQVFGQLSYMYFSFVLKIAAPYPSVGDIGYFGSIPLYVMGTLFLAKASGVKVNLPSFRDKLQAIVIPVIVLIVGYSLFLRDYTFDWATPLKIFLDFGYPLGQAIYLSLAILTYLLSKGVLGGMMKHRILFILLALCVQFASDYTFLYQTIHGTYAVGGMSDYLYLVSYVLMALGLIQLKTVFEDLKGRGSQ